MAVRFLFGEWKYLSTLTLIMHCTDFSHRSFYFYFCGFCIKVVCLLVNVTILKKKGNNLLLNWDKMKWFRSNCLYYLFTTYNLLRIWYFCSTFKHSLIYWIFTIWRNQFWWFLPSQKLQVEIWYEMFIFK